MEKKIQTYTTNQLCEIAGVSAPRIHQMRNGQNIVIKGKRYRIPPILMQKEHWDWKDSEVVFFPSALQAVLNRRKRTKTNKELHPNQQTNDSITLQETE